MTVHLLQPVAPSTGIPRAHPCVAWLEQARKDCGATPALLFRKVCACTPSHARNVWLCRTHEKAISRVCVCRECANDRTHPHRCGLALVKMPEAVDLIRSAR